MSGSMSGSMSLRKRLVLTVLGLLIAGLVIALGATFGALQDWQGDQNDDVLTSAGRHLRDELRALPEAERTLTDDGDGGVIGGVWGQLAAGGDLPARFELRDPRGRLRHGVGEGTTPNLPRQLSGDFLPVEPTPENPDGERFARAEPDWLIRTSRITDGGDILVVGMRTTRTDELVSRTMNVAFISGAIALAAVALLSLHAVRRGLRPLTRIAATAREISSGDLTRRVPAARPDTEVGQLSLALNTMLGHIETAFADRAASQERLRRFVADAAHELRTPIATIRGHAELFRRGASTRPDDLAKVMQRIEDEAARMGSLVDELLLLARLDQGRPLEREPVELTELATRAVADASMSGRHIDLVAPETVTVVGDAARLRQVLDNLLTNVVRHTPREATAVVRVHGADGPAVVEVADTGPGLSDEDREHVFERFYRADQSRSRDSGGAGLGLSIVAAVAEAHGGTATLTSKPGNGCTFRVTLPRD